MYSNNNRGSVNLLGLALFTLVFTSLMSDLLSLNDSVNQIDRHRQLREEVNDFIGSLRGEIRRNCRYLFMGQKAGINNASQEEQAELLHPNTYARILGLVPAPKAGVQTALAIRSFRPDNGLRMANFVYTTLNITFLDRRSMGNGVQRDNIVRRDIHFLSGANRATGHIYECSAHGELAALAAYTDTESAVLSTGPDWDNPANPYQFGAGGTNPPDWSDATIEDVVNRMFRSICGTFYPPETPGGPSPHPECQRVCSQWNNTTSGCSSNPADFASIWGGTVPSPPVYPHDFEYAMSFLPSPSGYWRVEDLPGEGS